MHISKVSPEIRKALEELARAEDALKVLGVHVYRHAAVYVDDARAHFSTRISVPAPPDDRMFDHGFADAVRDLSVEWSNAAHQTSTLVWKRKK